MDNMDWINSLQLTTSLVSLGLGGMLLKCCYCRREDRWSAEGVLITIIALLDCILSVYLVATDISRLLHPASISNPLCLLSFFFEQGLGLACLSIFLLLAVVRYRAVLNRQKANPLGWSLAASLLIIGLLVLFGLRTSKGKVYPYPSRMYCLPFSATKGKIASYMYFVFLLFYAPHLFIIPFCYLRIVCHYSQKSRGYSVTEFDTVKRINRKLLGLLAMTLVYWASILPHVIVFHYVYIFRREPPPVVDGLAYWLKGCFLIVNSLFPILFHSEIRDNFCSTFRSQPISFLHP